MTNSLSADSSNKEPRFKDGTKTSKIGSSDLSMVNYSGYSLKSLLHKAFSAKGRFLKIWAPFSRTKAYKYCCARVLGLLSFLFRIVKSEEKAKSSLKQRTESLNLS
jgi:hypothetical protein